MLMAMEAWRNGMTQGLEEKMLTALAEGAPSSLFPGFV